MSTGPAVALIAEPGDEDIAGAVTGALRLLGCNVIERQPRNETAAYRAELQDQLDAADLVIVIWTATSRESPWSIDQAEVAARQHKLFGISAGAKAPVGFAEARLKLKGRTLRERDVFLLREGVATLLEVRGAKPSRLPGIRWYSLLLHYALIALTVFLLDPVSPRPGQFNAPAFAVALPAALAGAPLMDILGRRLGIGTRAYLARIGLRLLGAAMGATVGIFALGWIANALLGDPVDPMRAIQFFAFLLADALFGFFIVFALPYLISGPLRRRLLA